MSERGCMNFPQAVGSYSCQLPWTKNQVSVSCFTSVRPQCAVKPACSFRFGPPVVACSPSASPDWERTPLMACTITCRGYLDSETSIPRKSSRRRKKSPEKTKTAEKRHLKPASARLQGIAIKPFVSPYFRSRTVSRASAETVAPKLLIRYHQEISSWG